MSIRIRIITAALVVVAVVNILYTIYFLDTARDEARARLQHTIDETNGLLKVVTAGPLYDGNVEHLKSDIESFFANQDILEVNLKEYKGDIAIHRQRPPPNELGEDVESRIVITRGIDELGEITVRYTTANIEERLMQSRNELIFFSMILMLGLSMVIYLVARGLTKPIDRLTDAARAMADGQLDQEIDATGAEELTILGQSFIRMRDAIREKMADLADKNTRLIQEMQERIRVEDELRNYKQHLEEMVEERTNELSAVNKELEAFSYSVSHDLRAPLRSIDGFSQALYEDYYQQLDDTGRDFLKRVRSSVQRMGILIDELLELSRVTRGEFINEQVNLSAIAQDIMRELQEGEPGRSVRVTIMPDLQAEGDQQLLRVMLANLLGNAWKYSSKRIQASIEFGALTGDNGTTFFVRDNGIGFDMQYVDKVFGVFHRLHGADEFPGTGIGLATVNRIIQRHGGKVWAESKPGEGATFYFTLR